MKNIPLFLILLVLGCKNTRTEESGNDLDTRTKDSLNKRISYNITNEEIVEIHSTDINFDNIEDTIYLLNPPLNDPGIFKKLFISITGVDTFSFVNNSAWDTIDNLGLQNDINSNLILLTRGFSYAHLYLFGYQYGCCPKFLNIVSIDNNSKVKEIFHKEFNVIKITDLNDDNNLELIGTNSFVQYTRDSLDFEIGTYVPFQVYTAFPSKVQIDYDLSKQYNIDNYVFVGFDYSEEIKICYPKDKGKPFLFNNYDLYRCNFDYLKKLNDHIDSLTLKEVEDFLLTFDDRCSNNIEFSEWSAGLLIKVLENNPKLFVEAMQSDLAINREIIYLEIKSPLHDLVKFKQIYDKLSKLPESEMKTKVDSLVRIAEESIK